MKLSSSLHLAASVVLGIFPLIKSFSVAPSASQRQLFSRHDERNHENDLVLTYLEINGFLMTLSGVTFLIDPILEGPLDFGIPSLYTGEKKVVPMTGLAEQLPPIDCILITQGLDDHAHVKTLTKLAMRREFRDIPVLAPPSAKTALVESGMQSTGSVRFLSHGETYSVGQRRRETNTNESETNHVKVLATKGALVGPPWQKRENGYILRGAHSVYIEPHVEFTESELRCEAPVDVVITPTVGQRIPILDLVYGPDSAVRLIETLTPKVIVPMPNSDVNQSGLVSKYVTQVGTKSEFEHKLLQSASVMSSTILELRPGQDEVIKLK